MAVDASLDSFRAWIGAQSTRDDALLSQALQTAGDAIRRKVYAESWNTSDVQLAVMMLANRLYKRRQSPEGTAGFGAEGLVVRILATDPDVRELIEPHLDMTKAGVA